MAGTMVSLYNPKVLIEIRMSAGIMSEPSQEGRSKPGRKPAQRKSAELLRYEKAVSRELRVLMASKKLPLKVVAGELEKMGIRETDKGLSAKLKKGTFSAAYYLAIKDAIDALADRTGT